MTAIALKDITVHFGYKQVLNGVDFEIETGDKAAIVGNNGAGKTTLLRIIIGNENCDSGQVTIRKGVSMGYLEQASVIADSNWTVREYLLDAQKEIHDLEQSLRTLEERFGSLTGRDLEKVLAEYDRMQNRFIALDGYAAEEQFNKICSVFGIDGERLAQPCVLLSGGQLTIVKLAAVLLKHPDILLLDEPTNHIDIDALKWLEEFIRSYNGTVLLVSHDRYFMDKTVNKTIMLEEGRASVFNGNYSFCLQEQERLMMLEIEQYKNRQKQIEAMKVAIKRFREWGARGDNPHMFRKANNMEKKMEALEALDRPNEKREKLPLAFETGKRSGKRVLTVRKLTFAYDEKPVLRNIDLEIIYRERMCLMGGNGSGKTTLLRLLLGEIPAENGSIVVGESVRIGYIEQVIRFENERETVLEAFKNAAVVHENEARKILARYFFQGDAVYKRLENLSGGERVIIKLALLMRQSVNFLILDEPTNHLDIDAREMLEEALLEYSGTLLFVSHDRFFINKLANRIAFLENGKITLHEGNYDTFASVK